MKSNPFSTRFVRPGQLKWIEPTAEENVQALANRFRQQLHSRAAIVGPHGTGKSTLLEHLVPCLGPIRYRIASEPEIASEPAIQMRDARGCVVWQGLRRANRPLRQILASRSAWQAGGLLVLDGFEQLCFWEQMAVLFHSRWRRMGILVTCHRKTSMLPTLMQTQAKVETVRNLVSDLLKGCPEVSSEQSFADPRLLHTLLEEEQGNVREVFMRLYDRFEERPEA